MGDLYHESAPRTRGSSQPQGAVGEARPVGPAHAGVIPAAGGRRRASRGRPRARGGHPTWQNLGLDGSKSAPRTRGSSRSRPALELRRPGRPRARGGHPTTYRGRRHDRPSAPRTRGSSQDAPAVVGVAAVGPAHAGVIRRTARPPPATSCRPRARGGHPQGDDHHDARPQSAPRTRGSSVELDGVERAGRVGPAHAGVIRSGPAAPTRASCRPRARGGHPLTPLPSVAVVTSAPRTRGSSGTQ